MRVFAPSETLEAKAFVRWLGRQEQLLFSKIPIGDNLLTDKEGAKLRAMGVRRGVPDFIVVHVETGKLVFVEMKRRRGGKVSKSQKVWLRAMADYAIVAYGWHAARDYVKEKLLGKRTRKTEARRSMRKTRADRR